MNFNTYLLDMLLGKIVNNGNAHFFAAIGREFVVGAAVVTGTQPLFRVEPDTGLVLHNITSYTEYALFRTLQQKTAVLK